jgi:hypothetical protein
MCANKASPIATAKPGSIPIKIFDMFDNGTGPKLVQETRNRTYSEHTGPSRPVERDRGRLSHRNASRHQPHQRLHRLHLVDQLSAASPLAGDCWAPA